MKIKSLIACAIICLLSVSNIKSQTNILNVITPTSLVTCGDKDTIKVVIQSSVLVNNYRIEATMPSGYNYQGLVPNPNHSEYNVSNINAPVFEIGSISGGTNDTLSFLVRSSCGAITNDLDFQLYNNSGVPVGAVYTTSLINITEPLISFTGIVNTTVGNQSGINLNALVLRDVYTRTFRISYDAANGYLDSIVVCVPLNYHNLIGISTGNVTFNTAMDTAFYQFSTADFGGALSPGNNTFVFSDTVEIKRCPNSGSMTTLLEAKWGCFNQECNSDIELANALAASGNPDVSVSLSGRGYISAASGLEISGNFAASGEENYIIATIRNNATGGPENGAYNFETWYHPRSPWGTTFYGGEGFVFDSMLINNIKVPAKVLPSGQPYIDSLTLAQYNGGGLIDFDGDGLVDDLLPDSSFVVKVYFRFVFTPVNCGLNPNPRYPGLRRNGYRVFFDNMCEVSQPYAENQGYYTYLVGASGRPSQKLITPSSIQGGVPFTVSLQDGYIRSAQQLSKFIYLKRFIVSKGITISATPNLTWTRVDGSATVYDTLRPGAIFDTIDIWTNFFPHNAPEVTSIDLVNNCSQNLDSCAKLWVIGKTYLSFVNDTGLVTFTTPLVCDSVDILRDCGTTYKGVNISNPFMHRATFGWTDSTMTTKVNANTPGVVLNKAHNYDSIAIGSTIFLKDTAYDNLKSYMELIYSGGSTAVQSIPGAGYVEVYHTGIGISFRYNLPTPTIGTYNGVKTTYTYDLSNFIDSIRFAIGDNTYKYGGNVGSSVYRRDSIKVVMYAYSNRTGGEFTFQSLHSGFPDTLDPSDPCNPAQTADIQIIKNVISPAGEVRFRNSGCRHHQISAGHRATNGVTAPSTNHFGFEYKPTSFLDSLLFEWNPNQVDYSLQDTNSYWAQRYYILNQTDPILPPWQSKREFGKTLLRLDSVPLRFANGTQGDVGGGFWFTPSCGMVSSTTYYVTFYYRNYILGVNGPITGSPRYSLGFSSTYTPPLMTLTPLTPVVETITDTVCWDVRLSNGTASHLSDHNWLDLRVPNSNINIHNLIDITSGGNDTIPLIQYFNGKWAKLDTINGGEVKTYRICATFTGCDYDSILIRSSFNCAKYPLNPEIGYEETFYSCNSNVNSSYLYLDNRLSFMESPIISELPTPVNYCDTLDYQIRVRNSGLGSAQNLAFRTILPASNISLIPGSATFEYPDSSGNIISLPAPTYSSNYFQWDLTSYLYYNGLIKSVNYPDTNSGVISLKMVTGCPFTAGDQIQFQAIADHLCGQEGNSIPQASMPITLNGIPLSPGTYFSNTLTTDTLNICKGTSRFSLKAIIDSGVNSNGNHYLLVNLPDSNLNLNGSIQNVIGSSYLVSTIPNDTIINGNRQLAWQLTNGMPVGDSVSFDFDVASSYTGIDCGTIDIISHVVEQFSLFCAATTSTCNQIYSIIDSDTSMLPIEKGSLMIISADAKLDVCSDELVVNAQVLNNGNDVLASQGNFTIVLDTNYNNVADPFEPRFNTSLTDSLNYGDTGNLQLIISNYLSTGIGDVCHLFVTVDTSSACNCSYDELSTFVGLNLGYVDTLYTCGSTVTFDDCGFSSSYNWSYIWYYINGTLANPSYVPNGYVRNPSYVPPSPGYTATHPYYVSVIRKNGCMTIADTVTVIKTPGNRNSSQRLVVRRNGNTDTAFFDTTFNNPVSSINTCNGLPNTSQGNIVSIQGNYALLSISNLSTFRSDTVCIEVMDTAGCTITAEFVYIIEPKKDTIYVNLDPSVDSLAIACVSDTDFFGNLVDLSTSIYYDVSGFAWPFTSPGDCGTFWHNTFGANQMLSTNCPAGINNSTELAAAMTLADTNGNSWVAIGDSIFLIGSNGDLNYGWIYSFSPGFNFSGPNFSYNGVYAQTCDSSNLTYLNDSLFIDSLCTTLYIDSSFTGDTACVIACDDYGFCDTTIIIYGVIDTVPPYLSCMDTILYLGYSNIIIDTSFVLDSVWDQYLNMVWLSKDTFNCADTGLNQVWVYANDINGNIDSCLAFVTIIDTINPLISCHDTTIYLNPSGVIIIDTSYIFNFANDNCGIDSVWINDADTLFDCANTTKAVTIYVRDINNNIDSCIANVMAVDSILPVANCKDTIIYLDATGNYTIDSSYIDNGSFDNCAYTINVTPNNFNCNNLGNNSVKLKIVDGSLNTDSCYANVNVMDTISPVAICNNVTLQLDPTGQAYISTSDIDAGSSDNCGIVSMTISQASFNCSHIGQNSVELVVWDASGNSDTCIGIVTINDNTTPTVICPQNLTDTVIGLCEYTVPDYTDSLNWNDNCDSAVLIISQSPPAGTIIPINGTTTTNITVIATDLSSNADVCSFNVSTLCIDEIEIPQFFSPNGDGQNDAWVIPHITEFPDNNIKIFNRYGNILFEVNNYQNDWKGEVTVQKGANIVIGEVGKSIIPTGTYFYIVELGPNKQTYTGYVQIMK